MRTHTCPCAVERSHSEPLCIHENIDKFRLNGGFNINGGSKPFLNYHFLTLGFFLKKSQSQKMVGLEPPLSLKPPFKGKFFIFANIHISYDRYFVYELKFCEFTYVSAVASPHFEALCIQAHTYKNAYVIA